jgi:hypothetical protein
MTNWTVRSVCLLLALLGGVAGADDISDARARLVGEWSKSGKPVAEGDPCQDDRGMKFSADGDASIRVCEGGKLVSRLGKWKLDFANNVDTVVLVDGRSYNVRFRSVGTGLQARFEEGADSKSDPSTAFVLTKVAE